MTLIEAERQQKKGIGELEDKSIEIIQSEDEIKMNRA